MTRSDSCSTRTLSLNAFPNPVVSGARRYPVGRGMGYDVEHASVLDD